MIRSGTAKRGALTLVCGALMTPALASPVASAPADQSSPTDAVAADRFEHTVSRHRLHGIRFLCGDLTLTVARGTEIETQDTFTSEGTTRIFISRTWRHVRLTGSDDGRYRVSGVTNAWFVLKAPDFDHPVRGDENIIVVFRSAADSSPGFLRERISWRDGNVMDVVSGPCDFA